MKTQRSALATTAKGPESVSARDEVLALDPAHSAVVWHGQKVVGGGHHGKVAIKSGSVTIHQGQVKRAEVIADLSSLTNDDLADQSWNEKLVGHLKSPDFFDVQNHPHARLVVDQVKSTGPGEYLLQGILTIKGQSHPIQFKATERYAQGRRLVQASLSFDRTAYDIRYGSGRFFENLGDKMIADDVKLEIEVALLPKKDV